MYDVVIIGGGIGGLMTAYRLKRLAKTYNRNYSIAVVDKGPMINKRNCPAAENKTSCCNCRVCSITSGFAGAGAFSDGKFNIGTAYGGTLSDEIGEEVTLDYIRKAYGILCNFDDFNDKPINIYKSDNKLALECIQNNLQLLDMEVAHFGTDGILTVMTNLIQWLQDNGVELISDTKISDIIKDEHGNIDIVCADRQTLQCDKVVIATGRSGSSFVDRIVKKYNVNTINNAVDIGVRVEMKDVIWKKFSSRIYEPKIRCKTKTFQDMTRMFCFNQGGVVSAENNDGVITVNGHSFSDENKKTDNCNFAILSSINFTEPFDDPTAYAMRCSKMANMIGDGNVIVQRFGDLIRGHRSTDKRISENSVRPTLKATAGDLSLVLPYRILTNIKETIYALDKVAPGTANDDTLLYGIESKYYSIKPLHDTNFQVSDGIYLIGDGSGICRGLSQSAAMGLYVADKIYF